MPALKCHVKGPYFFILAYLFLSSCNMVDYVYVIGGGVGFLVEESAFPISVCLYLFSPSFLGVCYVETNGKFATVFNSKSSTKAIARTRLQTLCVCRFTASEFYWSSL